MGIVWGLLALVVAAPALAQTSAERAWRAEEAVDGCQVTTREVPGRPYVAARASCIVPAELEVVARVLRDIERYPEWMQDCSQTKILKVVDRERDVYVFWFRQHIALFADRDMVLRSEVPVHEKDRRVIRATSTNDTSYDAGRGYVRMPSFASEWVLERVGAQQTRVSFMIEPDLGAGLPTGIANSVIAKTPLQSIRQGLTRMAKRPEYLAQARDPGAPRATADAR